ncbi:MAG TPA: tetratricopeptide repeat protein, partial [Longimicrobium sp.]|nr:tetratricopeptide repeat protein [Longimicrobium sp.]
MADISPDLAARIESLKASHAENPARFFMPLASAWREAGEVGKAEELLRENLKRHPGYLSAHVLLGRCLADRGALAEARNEFQYVLSVDPQNLIALRTLGDMAAAQGQQADARRWYNELLAVDPMNADARQALHHLDANPAPPPPPPTEPKPNDDFGIVDLAGTPDAAGGEPADFGAWGEVGIDAGTDDIASAGERAADAAGPAWGEAPLDAAPAEWSSESAPAGDADAWGAVDLDADRAEDFAPTSADDRSASADGFDALDFGAVDVSSADTSFEASEPEPAASGFDGWGSVDDGQLDAASATPPLEGLEAFADAPVIGGAHDAHDDHAHEEEEVVTETMAELYARQGFLDRSADVYRELISRCGAEPALVRRLEELEAQMEGAAPSPSSSPYDFDTDEEEEAGPPAWLQAVDAASTASDDEPALPDLGLETTLPDLPTDLAAPPAVEAEEAQALADVSGASPFPISAGEPATADPGFVDSAPAGSDVGISMSGSGTFVTGGDPFADSFARGFGDADDMAADVGAGDERAAWETPTVEETEPVPGMLLDETPAFAVDTSAVDSAAAAYADFDDEPADRPAADLDQPTEDQPTEDQPAEDQPAEDQPAEIAALAEDVSIFAEPIDFASAAGDASAETEAEESAPAVESAPAAGEPSIRAY